METYQIRTFGCQMNKHDAERVSGLLRSNGLRPATGPEPPDLTVFLTCCVRENADIRLFGQVASLKALKSEHPGSLIAVGGCIAQRDGAGLLERLPHVDIVFGTHNIASLPSLIDRAARGESPSIEIVDDSADFASDLPAQREHPWHAWLPIAVGCDNYCTYCIVPYVRGPERSRPLEHIVSEAHALVADAVKEITLLGQNVNSYGRDLYGAPRFAEALRRIAGTGVGRIRFATSHPKDLSDETIEAMASLDPVCKALHLPLQSGSDRVLAAMNRTYDSRSYLELVGRLLAAMPSLALSTDIIVGFPGETEEDFERTMEVVEAAHLSQAFTFIYSPRKGTPAAEMTDQVPREVAQRRFDRLVETVQRSAFECSRALAGTSQTILVEGPSKRDPDMLSGRTDGNRVVHVPLPRDADAGDLAGRFIDVVIEEAHTWFLTGRIVGYEPG